MNTSLDLPPLIASRYRPVRFIGKGGMGAVYEVEHARTGEHLAMKVLLSGLGSSAEAVERFKREARASARIKSEHVVRVTDADVAVELDGAPFLVMELLEGTDLEQAATAAPPGPATVVAWLGQVAQTIDKAHRLGIIHRDLKPENLFLATGEGRLPTIKILDFGIAKMLDEGTAVTGAGQMLGTPKYMSPEQASPNTPVTPATDRCALGLIAYRLLVGTSYYQGGAMGILGQILHGALQAPSACGAHFGEAFDAWFAKACHRDPGQRFASAAEQVHALAKALGLPRSSEDATLPGAAAGSLARASARTSSRRPAVLAGLVAGAVALSVMTLLVHRRDSRTGAGAFPSTTIPSASLAPPIPRPVAPTAAPPANPAPPANTETASTAHPPDKPRSPRRRAAMAPTVAGTAPVPVRANPDVIDPYAEQK